MSHPADQDPALWENNTNVLTNLSRATSPSCFAWEGYREISGRAELHGRTRIFPSRRLSALGAPTQIRKGVTTPRNRGGGTRPCTPRIRLFSPSLSLSLSILLFFPFFFFCVCSIANGELALWISTPHARCTHGGNRADVLPEPGSRFGERSTCNLPPLLFTCLAHASYIREHGRCAPFTIKA